MKDAIPDSIDTCPPGEASAGQLAHPDAIAHGQRLERRFYPVGDHAWCLVGNGLSNQTFIDGPEGIIAIDTGESVEEMQSALDALRAVTDKPIAAVIYSHFHYVNGTAAVLADSPGATGEIYGHADIEHNLNRFGGEIAPRSARGLVRQFGTSLPDAGPDGLLHCGLGRFYRNPEHAPFSPGYVPATHLVTKRGEYTIAGLKTVLTHAPSDASDSLTIWFPELHLCVNNLVWPSLFNIYAIRGEEYRDPRVLLDGIDEIYGYEPEHLICTHGPPISGAAVAPAVLDFRDAIQFIWDQTVRGANRGLSLAELVATVILPEHYRRSYFTRQFYGLVEHHVRQIHAGLFGWLDEDDSHLFPLPNAERYPRLIKGFGGAATVRRARDTALKKGDWRWAVELATWLCHQPKPTPKDRRQLAAGLRAIGQHSTSANVRNWCLTRALEWEGEIDLSRLTQHRFRYNDVIAKPATHFIPVLRVLLNPERAEGVEDEVAWCFPGGATAGLRVRNQVAVPTSGDEAELRLTLSHETWAAILADKARLRVAEREGLVSLEGDFARARRFFHAFDHTALQLA